MTEHVAALLPGLPPPLALETLRRHAELHEAPCTDVPGGLEATLWGGTIRVQAGRGGVRLLLSAPDMSLLFVLQEAMGAVMEAAGAAPLWDRVDEGALAPNLALLRMQGVTALSPSFLRMRLVGADLVRFARDGLHVRLLLPPLGGPVDWPRVDARGRTRWPEGAATLHRPVYTIRALDPAAGWLDIDLFRHAGGRAVDWALAARRGAEVGLMGPGGGGVPQAAWVGLFGDETALPAIARILASLPATAQGVAHVKVAGADLPDLPRPPGITLHRVASGTALLAALEAAAPPGTDRFLWFAAEKAEAAAARVALVARGFAKTEMTVAAYWSATGD